MKWILLFLTISVLLHACGNAPPPPMPKKFQPVVNPSPNYFMTVKGHVAPELLSKINLKWQAIYSTTNPACDKTYNKFEGVVGWRQVALNFETHVDKQGNYEIKIPLDHYRQGFCQWKISMLIDYSGISNHGSSIAQFYPCGKSQSCIGRNDSPPDPYVTKVLFMNVCKYDLKTQLSCTLNNKSYGFNDGQQIPRNNNYLLTESYMYAAKENKS